MKYKKGSILIVLIVLCIKTNAQSFDRKEPIDRYYEDCLQKDTSISNISNCAFQAYDKWEKELDKAYNKLLKELKNPKDKNALVQSQKAWQAYRDGEFHVYNNLFNMPGGKWTFIRANDRVGIIKARVLQLREYYQILTSKE